MKDRKEYLKEYRQANKEKIKAQQRNKARQLEIYAQNPSLRPVFVERYQFKPQATEPQ